jgi:hypothetical protein
MISLTFEKKPKVNQHTEQLKTGHDALWAARVHHSKVPKVPPWNLSLYIYICIYDYRYARAYK